VRSKPLHTVSPECLESKQGCPRCPSLCSGAIDEVRNAFCEMQRRAGATPAKQGQARLTDSNS